MTYKLAFNESALKEWNKLGHTIQEQIAVFPADRHSCMRNMGIPQPSVLVIYCLFQAR